MGHVFAVLPDQSILKYRDSTLLVSVNHRLYGPLHSIDASNPFEIYLFYKDAGVVLITDNQLSVRNVINLNATLIIPAAIARSYDNGLWIFDISDQQLKKYDKQLRLMHESGNVLRFSQSLQDITCIEDLEFSVFMFDKSGRLEEFDIFANHIRTLTPKGSSIGQIAGKSWYYRKGDALYRYRLDSFAETLLCHPDIEKFDAFRIQANRLFLKSESGIQVFTLTD